MSVKELMDYLRRCDPDAKVLIGVSMEEAAYVNEDEDEDGKFVEITTWPAPQGARALEATSIGLHPVPLVEVVGPKRPPNPTLTTILKEKTDDHASRRRAIPRPTPPRMER